MKKNLKFHYTAVFNSLWELLFSFFFIFFAPHKSIQDEYQKEMVLSIFEILSHTYFISSQSSIKSSLGIFFEYLGDYQGAFEYIVPKLDYLLQEENKEWTQIDFCFLALENYSHKLPDKVLRGVLFPHIKRILDSEPRDSAMSFLDTLISIGNKEVQELVPFYTAFLLKRENFEIFKARFPLILEGLSNSNNELAIQAVDLYINQITEDFENLKNNQDAQSGRNKTEKIMNLAKRLNLLFSFINSTNVTVLQQVLLPAITIFVSLKNYQGELPLINVLGTLSKEVNAHMDYTSKGLILDWYMGLLSRLKEQKVIDEQLHVQINKPVAKKQNPNPVTQENLVGNERKIKENSYPKEPVQEYPNITQGMGNQFQSQNQNLVQSKL